MYTAKVVVWFEIRTRHSTQSEHHVEHLAVRKTPLGLKRGQRSDISVMNSIFRERCCPSVSFYVIK
jgi:hypothetical protein